MELENLPDDPHLKAVGFFRPAEHPTEGSITVPDIAVQFSRTPGEILRLQPNLGEHTDEILRESGYDDDQIEKLRNDGAINQ